MNIPLPFRVAAGVVAAGLEQLRRLPEELPGLPVTLAGSAVRASLRVQQTLAELATKGDELLASWTDTAEENPSWARFDDDELDGDLSDGDAEPGMTDSAVKAAGDDGAVDDAATKPSPAKRKTTARTKTAPAAAAQSTDDYDALTLAQVRARLGSMTADEVEALLEREQQGRARASFLTVLGNRLISARAGEPDRP